jgi:hypothetical protein
VRAAFDRGHIVDRELDRRAGSGCRAPYVTIFSARGKSREGEQCCGTPVQFLPSPNELSDAALQTSVSRDLEGVTFRVIDPEHLCALWLQAGGAKRRERVEVLKQSGVVDENKLQALLNRYGVVR